MRSIEIESNALRVIQSVAEGRPYEDMRVELKSVFPADAVRAARQLAAHANSAFGEPVFWIVGVDEKQHRLLGTSPTELANWWPAVSARFDGATPGLSSLVVEYDSKKFQVLQFDTDRAPFLVKNADPNGTIQREVPWREGNTTRTAKREELLLMLRPEELSPEIELIEGGVRMHRDSAVWRIKGQLVTYIVPQGKKEVVIPFHRCTGRVRSGTETIADQLDVTCIPYVQDRQSHQGVVRNPCRMRIEFVQELPHPMPDARLLAAPTVSISLGCAGISRRVCVEAHLPHVLLSSPHGWGTDAALDF